MTREEINLSVNLMLAADHQGSEAPAIFVPLCEALHAMQNRYEQRSTELALHRIDIPFLVVFYVHLSKSINALRQEKQLPSEDMAIYQELYMSSLLSANAFLQDETNATVDSWQSIYSGTPEEHSNSAEQSQLVKQSSDNLRMMLRELKKTPKSTLEVNSADIKEYLPQQIQDYLSDAIQKAISETIRCIAESPEENATLLIYLMNIVWLSQDTVRITEMLLQSILSRIQDGKFESACILTTCIGNFKRGSNIENNASEDPQKEAKLLKLISDIHANLKKNIPSGSNRDLALNELASFYAKLETVLQKDIQTTNVRRPRSLTI